MPAVSRQFLTVSGTSARLVFIIVLSLLFYVSIIPSILSIPRTILKRDRSCATQCSSLKARYQRATCLKNCFHFFRTVQAKNESTFTLQSSITKGLIGQYARNYDNYYPISSYRDDDDDDDDDDDEDKDDCDDDDWYGDEDCRRRKHSNNKHGNTHGDAKNHRKKRKKSHYEQCSDRCTWYHYAPNLVCMSICFTGVFNLISGAIRTVWSWFWASAQRYSWNGFRVWPN